MQRRPGHNANQLEPFIHCLTILRTSFRRKRVFLGKQFSTIMIIVAIMLIHYVIFEIKRIDAAEHPGPCLRRRGPRSLDSRIARRNREGQARDIPESKAESCENGLMMLHFDLK